MLKSLASFFTIVALSFSVNTTIYAQDCAQAHQTISLAPAIAMSAEREYREFNGHRIGADGELLRFGSTESEAELLRDPATGQQVSDRPGRFAWRRVWEYWTTLGKHVPSEPFHRKLIVTPGILEHPGTKAKTREIGLGALLPALAQLDDETRMVLTEAVIRAALHDSAWSAAFISYLMNAAGMTSEQFRYSPTHSDYIKEAFESRPQYAFRACDPQTTMPKTGDLLCYSRGKIPLSRFSDWRDAVNTPGFITASHCEVVAQVDLDARKIDTIGGNVMHSVVKRRLKLNDAGTLSASYTPDRHAPSDDNACLIEKTCKRQNLNIQYWSVLLQLK